MSTTTPSQQQGHRAADAAQFQKAFLRDWENHLRNLGVTGPPDLAPAGALGEALRRSRAIESCRVVCSNCTEIIVALWEDQMKDNSSTINAGLIFDGILFATYLDRGRYIGTGTKNRARWLEKNTGKWWRLQDVLESAAPPVKHDAEVRPVATDASTSPACSEAPDASETPARVSLPDDRRTTAAPVAGALSPSQIAKNEIAIGDVYMSAPRASLPCWVFRKGLFRVDARMGMGRHT